MPLPLPLLPPKSPPFPQGRSGGGVTFRWPGGSPSLSGQGGSGLRTLAVTGCGGSVGRGVGLTVGFEVGSGVALGVPVGVAVGTAVAAGVGSGVGGAGATVGLGRFATTGLTLGMSDGSGSADGPTDGSSDGATDGGTGGSTIVAVGVGMGSPSVGVACAELAEGAIGSLVGVAPAPATSAGVRLGPTNPAVSATVARTRLRTPMATTSRAR